MDKVLGVPLVAQHCHDKKLYITTKSLSFKAPLLFQKEGRPTSSLARTGQLTGP